jgi:hypothetical protein
MIATLAILSFERRSRNSALLIQSGKNTYLVSESN